MKVAIYRTVGHLDRQFVTTKFFYSWESAERFCKYVAQDFMGTESMNLLLLNNIKNNEGKHFSPHAGHPV